MGFYIIWDIGFLIFLVVMGLGLMAGTAYGIVNYLNNNLTTIVFICVAIVIIEFAVTWLLSKKFFTALLSIIYSSQFCVFVVYGIYQLGLMCMSHPIKCVLLFVCYAFYSLFNSLGLMLPVATTSTENDDGSMGKIGLVALGLIGWIVNWIVLF